MEAPPRRLFCVSFKVRPSVDHPRFYDWQFGILHLWIFGTDDDDAGERAEIIIQTLPYEIVGDSYSSLVEGSAEIEDTPPNRTAAACAKQFGFGLSLSAAATGWEEPKESRPA
jgi:hypothetical protein